MALKQPFLYGLGLISALLCIPSAALWMQCSPGVSTSLPVAPVRAVTEEYYGTKVIDPYRYMEKLDSPDVQSWLRGQNDYTRATLKSLPGRAHLLQRIRDLDQSAPAKISSVRRLPGNIYMYLKLLPRESIWKLYLREGLDGQEIMLLDPSAVKVRTATIVQGKNAIVYFAPSNDARYVAVGIAPGGSENDTELHVVEVATKRETGDIIAHALYSIPNWLSDNHSFVYSRLQTLPPGAPAEQLRQKYRAYLHVLGAESNEDRPIFGYGAVPSIDVDPRQFAYVSIQPTSHYAIGALRTTSPNAVFYIAASNAIGRPDCIWRKVANLPDQVEDIAVHGDDLYVLTYKNASRFKIVRTDARNPDLSSAETVVGPSESVIIGMAAAKDALYVQLLDGDIGRILRVPFAVNRQAKRLALPFEGSVSLTSTDLRLPGTLFTMASWTSASRVFDYDPGTGKIDDTGLQPAGLYDHPSSLRSVEVRVQSYDGTMVPLSIVYPKGLRLNGLNPTILYGYGAYGGILQPSFTPDFLAWTDMGGVKAYCHVRGGGEYGEDWHLAGKGLSKPNTWRDFIACAEYLVAKKYTSREYLGGMAASAGGILIGRSITERPDLFGAAIIIAGWSDMVRNETTANGVANISEVGSTKTQNGFQALLAMSSYYQVKSGTAYPAVLLTHGINDPRVAPWHSAKLAARLQAASSSGKPVLLRIDYEGGHGIGSTEAQQQEALADQLSFLLWQFGVVTFQPKGTACNAGTTP